jgi:hypothetical protein
MDGEAGAASTSGGCRTLDERTESVWNAPVFNDLASDHAQDIEYGDPHRPTRWRVPEEGTVVRSGRNVPGPHEIALHANSFDAQVVVREGAMERCDDGLDSLRTRWVVWTIVLVLQTVLSNEFLGDFEAAKAEAYVD